MTTTTATPPVSFDFLEEAKALASAVALTVGFTAVYTMLAPVVLLGALLGGPLWAVLLIAREHAVAARADEEA
jgi:hypothetical protein